MTYPVLSRAFVLRQIPLVISLWAAGVGTTVAQTTPPVGAAAQRVLPMEVVINGNKSGTWVLIERDGMLYAPKDAFDEWRVSLRPSATSIRYQDTDYYSLAGVPGYESTFNAKTQSVDVKFSPLAFGATRIDGEKYKLPVVTSVLPSMFVNYDLSYASQLLRSAPTVKELGLLSEIGASNE